MREAELDSTQSHCTVRLFFRTAAEHMLCEKGGDVAPSVRFFHFNIHSYYIFISCGAENDTNDSSCFSIFYCFGVSGHSGILFPSVPIAVLSLFYDEKYPTVYYD